jgi:hypothetical protein
VARVDILGVLIQWPWLALLPIAVFATLFVRLRTTSALAAALAWLAYLPYEYAMKLRWLCSGECNIRVDLLVLYPLLLLVSAIALWRSLRRRR